MLLKTVFWWSDLDFSTGNYFGLSTKGGRFLQFYGTCSYEYYQYYIGIKIKNLPAEKSWTAMGEARSMRGLRSPAGCRALCGISLSVCVGDWNDDVAWDTAAEEATLNRTQGARLVAVWELTGVTVNSPSPPTRSLVADPLELAAECSGTLSVVMFEHVDTGACGWDLMKKKR